MFWIIVEKAELFFMFFAQLFAFLIDFIFPFQSLLRLNNFPFTIHFHEKAIPHELKKHQDIWWDTQENKNAFTEQWKRTFNWG